ncbi:hypothetical protein DB345_02300 [Spartobacteria bacterium LR76]|nr:hypothetical protein DB345_02300 [Spartobacteria bacterium LR76]
MTTPSVEEFQATAERYCGLFTREEPIQASDIWTFRDLLLRLIFHITAVESHQQAGEHENDGPSNEEFARAVKKLKALPFDYYRVVFDPHDFEEKAEPVTGSLSDDLADIYRDLAEGMALARDGHIDDACFHWALTYRSHWARHAVSALAAIEIHRTDRCESAE